MSEATHSLSAQLSEPRIESYRALSVASVVCLITGALSLSAMAHPLFLVLPASAVLSGVVAIRRIRRSEGELTGETAATAGLTLGVVFFIAGLGAFYIPRWQGKREATAVGLRFLEYLQTGETTRAVNMTEPPGFQLPENANFAEVFATSRKAQKRLMELVNNEPIVSIMAKLGSRAQIRPYDIEAYGSIEGELGAHIVYQIEYTDSDRGPREFLVMLQCAYRRNVEKPSEGGWFIRKISGPPYIPYSVRVREAAAHQHGETGESHDHGF